MAKKPSIPKGTRDFGPAEVARRNHIIEAIREQFERFGFQPIETPSFENYDTLMGKYGEEGDRLIFKILDSGDVYRKLSDNVENAISIFVALTYIFRDVTTAILEDLDRSEVEFATRDELSGIINRKNFLEHYDNKLEEWAHFLIDNYKYRIVFTQKLTTLRDVFLGYCTEFIFGRGIDFKQVRSQDDLSQHYFSWADRHIIKQFTSEIFGLIEQEIPYVKELSNDFLITNITEKALRYDLTVPFARYVVMHQNDIDFPFKRYQIQPVWRADRPQRGRFREFYQCDADVVGATGLIQEAEFIQLYDRVFASLGLDGVTIKLNHRKVLSGIAEVIGAADRLTDFTVVLDKLDKIGREKVEAEMEEKGISREAIRKTAPLFDLSGEASGQLAALRGLLAESPTGLQGVEELEELLDLTRQMGLGVSTCVLDVTLARGLNYYTGTIFEVAAPETVQMGSIGGGGRYDDLTGIFGLRDVSGVGISFGLDRIYLVMEELGLFPETLDRALDVFCINFGPEEARAALRLVMRLRSRGIRADLYPNDAKVGKQFKYADKRDVPFVVLIGDEELRKGEFTVRDMRGGGQQSYPLEAWEEFADTLPG